MSDVLIKNIEIPKDNKRLALFIDKDGEVSVFDGNEFVRITDAIEVPTHGRLIDVDKLLKEHPRISSKYPSETFYENLEIFNMLSDAPSVIEASKERENDRT